MFLPKLKFFPAWTHSMFLLWKVFTDAVIERLLVTMAMLLILKQYTEGPSKNTFTKMTVIYINQHLKK